MPRRLMRISDDNLNSQLNAMRAMIRRARKSSGDTIDAEKELCWLEREAEFRDVRCKLDDEYKARIREEADESRRLEREALREYEE